VGGRAEKRPGLPATRGGLSACRPARLHRRTTGGYASGCCSSGRSCRSASGSLPRWALPDLQAAFGLTAAELSLLTAVYLWPFALMQPVAGLLTDTLGPRRSVTIFLIIAGLGQLLLALAPNFALALTGRACTGIGTSILYVAAARIMAQWFRRREFGTLTGAWTSVANLGGIVAAAPPGGPPARDRLARELRRDRRRGAVRRPAGVPRRAQQPDRSWLARPHRP
jgi:hypothetical protein